MKTIILLLSVVLLGVAGYIGWKMLYSNPSPEVLKEDIPQQETTVQRSSNADSPTEDNEKSTQPKQGNSPGDLAGLLRSKKQILFSVTEKRTYYANLCSIIVEDCTPEDLETSDRLSLYDKACNALLADLHFIQESNVRFTEQLSKDIQQRLIAFQQKIHEEGNIPSLPENLIRTFQEVHDVCVSNIHHAEGILSKEQKRQSLEQQYPFLQIGERLSFRLTAKTGVSISGRVTAILQGGIKIDSTKLFYEDLPPAIRIRCSKVYREQQMTRMVEDWERDDAVRLHRAFLMDFSQMMLQEGYFPYLEEIRQTSSLAPLENKKFWRQLPEILAQNAALILVQKDSRGNYCNELTTLLKQKNYIQYDFSAFSLEGTDWIPQKGESFFQEQLEKLRKIQRLIDSMQSR